METFVVRIATPAPTTTGAKPQELHGVVEQLRSKRSDLFRGSEQLLRLLNNGLQPEFGPPLNNQGEEVKEMKQMIRSRMPKPSPALALAMIALLAALTGTATAAGLVVTSKQIKDGTIQTVDISKAAQKHLNGEASGNSVEGSWLITVTRVNPPPGLPATFQSLMTFAAGGGLIETSSTGTSRRGPAHGVWERISGRTYATSMMLFRFDPSTGAFLGTQRVDRTMELSQDGQSFEGVSLATLFDPAGNVVLGGLRATEHGQRLEIERIPD